MHQDPSKMFRKQALNAAQSPEQLDQLIKVIPPYSWLILFTLFVMASALFAWGFLGSIKTTTHGSVLLTGEQGLKAAYANAAGTISNMAVVAGSKVVEGQVIARIDQPDLEDNIQLLENEKNNLTMKTQLSMKALNHDNRSQKQRIHILEQQAENQKNLYRKGLIVKSKWLETQYNINQLHSKIAQNLIQINELSNQKKTLALKISTLQDQYEELSQVIAPTAGKVIEVRSGYHEHVNKNDPLVIIEPTGSRIKGMEAIIFTTQAEGKKIKTGMQTLISPVTVKKERYGSLRAKIIYVSSYPVSGRRLMSFLHNQETVTQLLSQLGGSVYMSYADLTYDENTPSGYEWTSKKGPPFELQTGTFGVATITLKEQKPISLLLPALKKLLP